MSYLDTKKSKDKKKKKDETKHVAMDRFPDQRGPGPAGAKGAKAAPTNAASVRRGDR